MSKEYRVDFLITSERSVNVDADSLEEAEVEAHNILLDAIARGILGLNQANVVGTESQGTEEV